MKARKGKVANWYLDMNLIAAYLFTQGGAPHTYHTNIAQRTQNKHLQSCCAPTDFSHPYPQACPH